MGCASNITRREFRMKAVVVPSPFIAFFLSLKTLNSIFVKLCLKLYSVSFQLFGEFIHRMVETIHFLPVVLQTQCPMRSTVGPFDIQAPTKALEYDKHLLRKLYMS